MTGLSRSRAFYGLAACALVAALYHALGVIGLVPRDGSTPLRHGIFVIISLAGAWYFLRRPLWLVLAYIVLVGQQTLSHGGRLVQQWMAFEQLDALSVAVLLILYAGLALLLLDARDRSVRVQRLLCPRGASA